MNRFRHRKPDADQRRREQALRDWVTLHMGDDVAAKYAAHMIRLHTGLMYWIAAAEYGHALPTPTLGSSVSHSQEPDDRMLALVETRMETGGDPEKLEPLRQRLVHRLGDFASWYVSVAGEPDWDRWYYLAQYLGRLIGDQVAANALATCLECHRRLVAEGDTKHKKNARDRWYRTPGWHVRRRDGQPEKGRTYPSGRPVIQSVEGEGERRYG